MDAKFLTRIDSDNGKKLQKHLLMWRNPIQ